MAVIKNKIYTQIHERKKMILHFTWNVKRPDAK